jgi:hypothetical protein
MSLPIVSAIVAHKVMAAIVVASLVTSGGVVAVASNHSNVLGELSFTINPSYTNVTSLASLKLGTLTPGQTGTQSSTAEVNFTSVGMYGVTLVNTPLLYEAFSTFNVTITGLGTSPVTLSLNHSSQSANVTSTGIDNLTISVVYTVSTGSGIEHGITAANAPFIELIGGVSTPTTHTDTGNQNQ